MSEHGCISDINSKNIQCEKILIKNGSQELLSTTTDNKLLLSTDIIPQDGVINLGSEDAPISGLYLSSNTIVMVTDGDGPNLTIGASKGDNDSAPSLNIGTDDSNTTASLTVEKIPNNLTIGENDSNTLTINSNTTVNNNTTFIGTTIAPTVPTSTNNTEIATTAFVKSNINELIDSAPETLNTLNELSAALNDDENFGTTILNSLNLKAPIDNPTFTGIITGNITGDVTGKVSDISNHNTDSLGEGTLNKYFTNSRSRSAISVNDTGGDGALSYDSTTGQITYIGPSATETRAHFSGGTGVSITNGAISIGQQVGTSDNVTFNELNIVGNSVIGEDSTDTTMTVKSETSFLSTVNFDTGTLNNLNVTDNITISGTSSNVGLTINNTNSDTSNDPTITLQSDSVTKYVMGIDRSDNDKFKIGTTSVDTNTRFSIDTSGNVGIGTNNPISNLQIQVPGSKDATDASNFDHYGMIISKVGTPSNGTETGLCFDIQSGADPENTRGPGAAITHERTGSWSQGKLHFKTKQSNAEDADCVTAMTIAETGNVGIGNTSPIYKLDVNGTINSTTLKTNNIIESYDSSTITYIVTVANKTSTHPYYNDSGSSSAYFINGIESPYIDFVPGKTYRFDQSDGSNSTHPLRLYYEKDKTNLYTTGVTINGTQGITGAYTEIVVTTSTPRTLFYQCSAHPLMGNQVQIKGGNIDVLSGGTGNTTYTDGELLIGNSSGNTLSKGTLIAGTGISITNGNGSIEIENTASGSALTVQDEGNALTTAATTLNFVGSGVTASGTGTEKTITITGGSGSTLTVQDEGNSLTTAATTLNFVGSGVTASGDGATKTITISGGGSGGSSTLADLTDVSVSSPQSGQILQYNGTNWTTSPVDSSKLIVLAGEGVGNLVSTTNSGKSIDRGSFSLSVSHMYSSDANGYTANSLCDNILAPSHLYSFSALQTGDSNTPVDFTYDLKQSQIATHFKAWSHSYETAPNSGIQSGQTYIGSFVIYGSNNNTIWTSLGSKTWSASDYGYLPGTNAASNNRDIAASFDFNTDNNSYRYYKISVSNTQNGGSVGDNMMWINEIALYRESIISMGVVSAHTDEQTGNEDYLSALTVEGTKYKIGTSVQNISYTSYSDSSKLHLSFPFQKASSSADALVNQVNGVDATTTGTTFIEGTGFIHNSSDRTTVDIDTTITVPLTIFIRFYRTSSSVNYQWLFEAIEDDSLADLNNTNNYGIRIYQDNSNSNLRYQALNGSAGFTDTNGYVVGRWTHTCIVLDNSNNMIVYTDSSESSGVMTKKYQGTGVKSNLQISKLRLGNYVTLTNPGSGDAYNGYISDFYIFKTALSAFDAQGWANYINNNYITPGFPAPLKFLDDVSDTTPLTGDSLVYSEITNKWQPQRAASQFGLPAGDNAKVWWVAGENVTRIGSYAVTQTGSFDYSYDGDGHLYATNNSGLSTGTRFEINDSNALLDINDRTFTMAIVIDIYNPNVDLIGLYLQEEEENHFIYILNNKLYHNHFEDIESNYPKWTSVNNISTGKQLIVLTSTEHPTNNAIRTISLYINGSLIETTDSAADTYNDATPSKVCIGGGNTSARHLHNSKLYALATWERTLTTDEINQLTIDKLVSKRQTLPFYQISDNTPIDGQNLVYSSQSGQYEPKHASPTEIESQLCGGSLGLNDITTGWPKASRTYPNTSTAKLFDNIVGNYDTGWAGYGSSGNYGSETLQFRFNQPRIITKMLFLWRSNAPTQAPKVFNIYGSNTEPSSTTSIDGMNLLYSTDGSDHPLKTGSFTGSAQDNINIAYEHVIPFSKRGVYQYYTMDIIENYAGNTTDDCFTEMFFFHKVQNYRNYQYKQFSDRQTTNISFVDSSTPQWSDITGFDNNPLSISTVENNSKIRIGCKFIGEWNNTTVEYLAVRLRKIVNGQSTYLNVPNTNLTATLGIALIGDNQYNDNHDSTPDSFDFVYIDETTHSTGTSITYIPQITNTAGSGYFTLNGTIGTSAAGASLYHHEHSFALIEAEEILTGPPLTVNNVAVSSTPQKGDIVYHDGNVWKNTNFTNTPIDGQVLAWNNNNSNWIVKDENITEVIEFGLGVVKPGSSFKVDGISGNGMLFFTSDGSSFTTPPITVSDAAINYLINNNLSNTSEFTFGYQNVAVSNSYPVYLIYDALEPIVLTNYKMWPRTNGQHFPLIWKLEASNDPNFGTFTELDSQDITSSYNVSTVSSTYTATPLDNTSYGSKVNRYLSKYRYYRLNITSKNTSYNNDEISIGELVFYKKADEPSSLYDGNLLKINNNGTGLELTKNVDITGDVTGTVSDISNHSINGLSDVNTNTVAPTDGQALVWDNTYSEWKPGTVATSGGSSTLAGLTDVSIPTTPSDGQALVWDHTNSEWKAGTITGSGSGTTVVANPTLSGNEYNLTSLTIGSTNYKIPDTIDMKGDNVIGEDANNYLVINSETNFNSKATFNSQIIFNSQSTFNSQINMGASIIPTTNSQFDIGNAEYKVRHLYLSNNSIYMANESNTDENTFTKISLASDGELQVGDNKLAKLDLQGRLPNDKMPEGLLDSSGKINTTKMPDGLLDSSGRISSSKMPDGLLDSSGRISNTNMPDGFLDGNDRINNTKMPDGFLDSNNRINTNKMPDGFLDTNGRINTNKMPDGFLDTNGRINTNKMPDEFLDTNGRINNTKMPRNVFNRISEILASNVEEGQIVLLKEGLDTQGEGSKIYVKIDDSFVSITNFDNNKMITPEYNVITHEIISNINPVYTVSFADEYPDSIPSSFNLIVNLPTSNITDDGDTKILTLNSGATIQLDRTNKTINFTASETEENLVLTLTSTDNENNNIINKTININIINNFTPTWITQPNETYELIINHNNTLNIDFDAVDPEGVTVQYNIYPVSSTSTTVLEEIENTNNYIITYNSGTSITLDRINKTITYVSSDVNPDVITINLAATDGLNVLSQNINFSSFFNLPPNWIVEPNNEYLFNIYDSVQSIEATFDATDPEGVALTFDITATENDTGNSGTNTTDDGTTKVITFASGATITLNRNSKTLTYASTVIEHIIVVLTATDNNVNNLSKTISFNAVDNSPPYWSTEPSSSYQLNISHITSMEVPFAAVDPEGVTITYDISGTEYSSGNNPTNTTDDGNLKTLTFASGGTITLDRANTKLIFNASASEHVNITLTNTDNFYVISKIIEFQTVNIPIEIIVGGTVTHDASIGTIYQSHSDATGAFNKDCRGPSFGNTRTQIIYEYNTPKIITKYNITSRNDDSYNRSIVRPYPLYWGLYATNDDTVGTLATSDHTGWIQLDYQSNNHTSRVYYSEGYTWTTNHGATIELTNTNQYKYYKLDIIVWRDGGVYGRGYLGEWVMWGY